MSKRKDEYANDEVTVINIMADGTVCEDLTTYLAQGHQLPDYLAVSLPVLLNKAISTEQDKIKFNMKKRLILMCLNILSDHPAIRQAELEELQNVSGRIAQYAEQPASWYIAVAARFWAAIFV